MSMDNPTQSAAQNDPAVVKHKGPEFDPVKVQTISEYVYRARLCDESGEGADLRMIEKDKDNGEKLRGRAKSYDALTRAYLRYFTGAK